MKLNIFDNEIKTPVLPMIATERNQEFYHVTKIETYEGSPVYYDIWLLGKDLTVEEKDHLASVSRP